jgi:arylsulfatase
MKLFFTFFSLALFGVSQAQINKAQNLRPNVVLIMTDDQGIGDLGFYGNTHIHTPVLDKLARESTRFNRFFVSPVCAPTRASLMTGRNSLRTGIHDTYNGGAIMATEEVTLAEMLSAAGYRTAMVGKWHLGDNYPTRPHDQGFDEALYHLSGGIGQVGDWPNYMAKDSSYFDPVLWDKGKKVNAKGYCSDVFGDAAVDFIKANAAAPFFLYLAFNAPHGPFQVPQEYYDRYAVKDLSVQVGDKDMPFPKMNPAQVDIARKAYGMVTNIDDNVGKVMAQLKASGVAENTLVIFMTDNGASTPRYNYGLREKKGSVYQGGIQVPSFWHWPKTLKAGREIHTNAAHIDMLPTLASLCKVPLPKDVPLDGKDLSPLLFGGPEPDWKDRSIYLYWNRRYPDLYKNMTLIQGDLKLVAQTKNGTSEFGLYNLAQDPYEQQNLAQGQAERVHRMKQELRSWHQQIIQSRHLQEHPRAIIGTQHEPSTVLNRNDAFGFEGIWSKSTQVYGAWEVEVAQAGYYDIRFHMLEPIENLKAEAKLELGSYLVSKKWSAITADAGVWRSVYLPKSKGRLIPRIFDGETWTLPFWVQIEPSKQP